MTIHKMLNQAMLLLASEPNSIFLGQNVCYDGNVMYDHLEGIPESQRIEFPVAEELQLGVSIGLALQGYLPVSIYPRFDFLILATNQLVNHLDKLQFMSKGQFNPKVIIRTKVGTKKPIDAGPQHTQDHTEAYKLMLTNVNVFKITEMSQIMKIYREALESDKSSLIVEALG